MRASEVRAAVRGRLREAGWRARAAPGRLDAWGRFRRNRSRYRILDEDELRATRRSDTVFVFGSGSSIRDFTPAERMRFEEHDTLGFNWFVRQRAVRMDYHLIRGIPDTDLDRRVWRPQLAEYFRLIRESERYASTVFLVQTGFRATNGNRAIGYRLLPEGARVFLWRTAVGRRRPGASLAEGLSHVHSALEESVNFGYALGWKRIVLVGVDLYDRRYFWLPDDEVRPVDARRGATAADTHSTSGVIELLDEWAALMTRQGVELSVYNPRSLLAGTLPVYPRV